jgi:hypothetical protein
MTEQTPTLNLGELLKGLARFVLAMTGIALIVGLATVMTVLNGAESEAPFSWTRQIWYLAISATLLVALAWLGIGRRVGPRPYRFVARTFVVCSVAAASFAWLIAVSLKYASIRS